MIADPNNADELREFIVTAASHIEKLRRTKMAAIARLAALEVQELDGAK